MSISSSLSEVKYSRSDQFLYWSKCGGRTIVKVPKVFGVHRAHEPPTEPCHGNGKRSEKFNFKNFIVTGF